MPNVKIPASAFTFLQQVKKNNNRDWFNAHKDRYLQEHEHLVAFASVLLGKMNQHDVIETPSGKKSLHRIYRDTRFSKEKTPYKTNWSGGFKRLGKNRRGSYYFHIEKGNSFIGGGFWGPEPADLKRIRDEIAYDPKPLRKILKSKNFISHFGELYGEKVKTTPKGYDANDPTIDLIRYKQFLLIKKFTDEEVLSEKFVDRVNEGFKAMRPFLDYMTHAVTTDIDEVKYF